MCKAKKVREIMAKDSKPFGRLLADLCGIETKARQRFDFTLNKAKLVFHIMGLYQKSDTEIGRIVTPDEAFSVQPDAVLPVQVCIEQLPDQDVGKGVHR
jgi:hypothetical protein